LTSVNSSPREEVAGREMFMVEKGEHLGEVGGSEWESVLTFLKGKQIWEVNLLLVNLS